MDLQYNDAFLLNVSYRLYQGDNNMMEKRFDEKFALTSHDDV